METVNEYCFIGDVFFGIGFVKLFITEVRSYLEQASNELSLMFRGAIVEIALEESLLSHRTWLILFLVTPPRATCFCNVEVGEGGTKYNNIS